MYTLHDIAELAGCSQASVSRVMNGTAGVAPALADRIRRAIAALEAATPQPAEEHRPQRGRPRGSLSLSNTLDVILFRNEELEPIIETSRGLIISEGEMVGEESFRSPRMRLSMDFYRNILYGISSEISKTGLQMKLSFCRDLTEERLLARLRKSRHRGVLLLGSPDDTETDFIRDCGLPVVLVDILAPANVPVVTIDNIGGFASLIDHLQELGHKHIGFSGNDENPSFRIRHIAFCGEMSRRGLRIDQEHSLLFSGSMAALAKEWEKVLKRPHPPTAIVCANDNHAIAVVMAARKVGLRIPEDISVTGFDNIEAAERLQPALTTVRVPTAEMGACAANLLLNLTQTPSDAQLWSQCEIRFRTSLIVRASTGPARAID